MFFEQMLCVGVKSNHSMFASVLMACSCLAALETGRQIHGWLVKSELGILLHDFSHLKEKSHGRD